MQYSFTEKKRVRKDFGKRPDRFLEVPYMLQIQLASYRRFLQEAYIDRRSIRHLDCMVRLIPVFPID